MSPLSPNHNGSDSEWLSEHSSSSPTESEREFLSGVEGSSPEPEMEGKDSTELHAPPFTTPSTCPLASPPKHGSSSSSSSSANGPPKPLTARYPRVFANTSTHGQSHLQSGTASRPTRLRGMTPLTNATTQQAAGGDYQPRLPKSQPLSRALFARMAPDAHTSSAGLMTGGKKKTSQKIIVPSKSFRTTFELGLSASELARRE
ncbi:hypothetical protein IAU60_006063 [Kwoniella sp. DSM 27419]